MAVLHRPLRSARANNIAICFARARRFPTSSTTFSWASRSRATVRLPFVRCRRIELYECRRPSTGRLLNDAVQRDEHTARNARGGEKAMTRDEGSIRTAALGAVAVATLLILHACASLAQAPAPIATPSESPRTGPTSPWLNSGAQPVKVRRFSRRNCVTSIDRLGQVD